MRAGVVAIFCFAALLALGHYVAAPMFCRGGLAIPTLDPRALCGADLHFNRAGSVLLYFSSIAGALFLGIVAALIPARTKKPPQEKTETNPAETFEQIIAAEEKKLQDVSAAAASPAAPAAAEATPGTEAPKQPDVSAMPAASPEAPQAGPSKEKVEAAQALIEAAISAPAKPQTAPATPVQQITVPVAKPEPIAKPEPVVAEVTVKKTTPTGPFDGSADELIERFRELKKDDGVNAIAQAQRLLDESTMSALGRGVDPKQHLSHVAHLVLTEDPDLKSGVVRGVVVHVAARLKELGVAKPNLPAATKGAA